MNLGVYTSLESIAELPLMPLDSGFLKDQESNMAFI